MKRTVLRSMKRGLAGLAVVVCLLVLAGVGYGLRRQWNSPQGRLERLVAAGREEFTLPEILGDDWTAVCLLPPTYDYPVDEAEKGILEQQLSVFLGRKVDAKEWFWADFWAEGEYGYFVTDKGGIEGDVSILPWQGADWKNRRIACTRKKEAIGHIQRDRNGWFVVYDFEKYINFE